MKRNFQIFKIFLVLGLTSFGGPIAHIGFLHNKFVKNMKWLSNSDFSELLALCQFLPGPTSSQIVYAIGLIRSGFLGGALAWFGFTLPSAIIMCAFAFGINFIEFLSNEGLMRGLISVSVPIVGISLWQMSKSFCLDIFHWFVALGSILTLYLMGSGIGHFVVIIFGGVFGLLVSSKHEKLKPCLINFQIGYRVALILTAIFLFVLCGSIFNLFEFTENWIIFSNLFKSGSLVFGGGHVVLPLLQNDFVQTNLLNEEKFLAGYGIVQAVPGPLFSFSGYIGTLLLLPSGSTFNAIYFGALCVFWIFLPTFLTVPSVLFFWSSLREHQKIRKALSGINASVVGLMIHAFCCYILPVSLVSVFDLVLVILAFVMLVYLKLPAWGAVLLLGICGWVWDVKF